MVLAAGLLTNALTELHEAMIAPTSVSALGYRDAAHELRISAGLHPVLG
jgi:hypothetical protein